MKGLIAADPPPSGRRARRQRVAARVGRDLVSQHPAAVPAGRVRTRTHHRAVPTCATRSAAEAERLVAIPLEESLRTVSGIETISTRCSSRERRASPVELRSDADPTIVEADMRDRVERRVEPDLARTDVTRRTRAPVRGANDRPIIFFACTARGSGPRDQLSAFVEDVLNPRLESVDGRGARVGRGAFVKRSVRIWLDNDREVSRRQRRSA